jgi:NADP-dependent 3-hydroxy acid dehydrogenase YdfG
MAMSTSGLKSAILSEMANQGFNIPVSAYGEQYIEALATAIVTYIQTNATVTDESSTWPVQ